MTILRVAMVYCSGVLEAGSIRGWRETGATGSARPIYPPLCFLPASVLLMRVARFELQDRAQFGQVADLVGRSRDVRRQRLAVAVDPRDVHADLLSAEDVHVGAVADEERLVGADAQALERGVEDVPPRLAPADLVGHDDRGE